MTKLVNIGIVVVAIIGIVVTLVVATSLGPTVVSTTDTSSGHSLENASGVSKTMYSLVELLYPIMLVIFMISVGFGIGKKM